MANIVELLVNNLVSPVEQLERFRVKREELWVGKISMERQLIPDLANIVADYAAEALNPSVTNWHTILDGARALPERIPPLPAKIERLFLEQDGTSDQVDHSLYLIPPVTLNEFESRFNCSIQFGHYGHDNPRELFGAILTPDPQWAVMAKKILPGSENKTFEEQAAMIAALSHKTLSSYEFPSIREAVFSLFFNMKASEDSFNHFTYVKETLNGEPLVVGECSSGGVKVIPYNVARVIGVVGVAPVLKL